jgi:RNA polymerase sigma factor (sigma-70 family)
VEDVPRDFAEFYAASRDDCLRTLVAVIGDRGLAEDLAAEGFARAYAAWGKVSRHPAPAAWVVRTALNARVSRWRKSRREVPLAAHDVSIPAVSGGIDGALLDAVRRLPRRQREVLALRVFMDLDVQQTARVLGIAPNTVSVHLFRAVAQLRDRLAPIDAEEARP